MKFFNLINQSRKSTTMRVNTGFLGLLGLLQWDKVGDVVAQLFGGDTEVMAILAGVTAIFNLFQRTKTTQPLSEK